VRSKTPVAMVNEVLCKIICHNICVLIQESHELGIEVEFQKDRGHARTAIDRDCFASRAAKPDV